MAKPVAIDPGTLRREGLPPEPPAPNQADYVGALVVCGLVLCLCVSAILSQPDLRTILVVGAFCLILVALAAGHHVQYRQDVAEHATARRAWEASVRRQLEQRGATPQTPTDL